MTTIRRQTSSRDSGGNGAGQGGRNGTSSRSRNGSADDASLQDPVREDDPLCREARRRSLRAGAELGRVAKIGAAATGAGKTGAGKNGAGKNRAGKNGAGKNGAKNGRLAKNGRSNGARAATGDPGDASASLWARYRRTRSKNARNHLVERYRGIVQSMAQALVARLPRSVDVQDLTHAGVWGLMCAIESYEPERGSHFLPFMRIRVRGAMLDELRNLDYLPRLLRHRRRALEAALVRLRDRLNRDPSDAELAEELGLTETSFRRRFTQGQALPSAQCYREVRGLPHDQRHSVDGHADLLDELADDHVESPVEALNRQDLLEKIKASLQPIEWRVLELHYLAGLNGKEVARRLRLSASRVCQIHGRVMSRLKERLGAQ